MYRDTYVEINLDNIAYNAKKITETFKEYNYYFGVVKGNCYGHGYEIVNTLIKNGINYLAVSSLNEALEIRHYNKEIPILCLQPINTKYLDICEKNNITITIHSTEYTKSIVKSKNNLKAHIKIDSGMSRLGFNDKNELKSAINELKKVKSITLEGIYTHMGTSGIADIHRKKQLSKFTDITSLININDFKIVHIDRSITLQCQKKIPYCNGIRLGIILYGYEQKEIKRNFKENIKYLIKTKLYNIPKTNYKELNLKTAFTLYSKVIQIKQIKQGELVGYGIGYQAQKDMTVATIEIGYYDGLNLNYNNNFVFINKKKYKIIGTINMGMITIEADTSISEGDIVEMFGKNISAKTVAHNAKTTVYQLLTCIPNFIPRKYIQKERKD